MNETLARALVRRLGGIAPKPGPHTSLRGVSQIDKVVQIDQSPIGRTPRSNPATYTGVFDEIRKVFANTRDARERGYKAGPLQLQRQGRPLRRVPGAGAAADRNELPARSLRHLPGVRREALQPPDAGNPLPRPLDRRRARHAGRRGRRVLREFSGHRPAAGQLAGSRPGLRDPRPVLDHALRRRGPAHQAGRRAGPRRYRQDRSISSTSRPPACTSTTSASCWPCSAGWSIWATRCW